ncbi:MAG: hypothetical protein JXR97_16000 [Planctomycetes bacterium]|nr:hypothetical protein [Planctomycetota bacterium]
MSWISGLFQSETLPVLESTMGFAYQKQLAIMNNIANVETPYYKRQDVPEKQFLAALSDAVEKRATQHPNSFEIRGDFDISFIDNHYPVVRAMKGSEFGPERHDENSVVIEKEMAELAKNTMALESTQRLYKKKMQMLRSSLRDSVA